MHLVKLPNTTKPDTHTVCRRCQIL